MVIDAGSARPRGVLHDLLGAFPAPRHEGCERAEQHGAEEGEPDHRVVAPREAPGKRKCGNRQAEHRNVVGHEVKPGLVHVGDSWDSGCCATGPKPCGPNLVESDEG